jgi:hypothetical protein
MNAMMAIVLRSRCGGRSGRRSAISTTSGAKAAQFSAVTVWTTSTSRRLLGQRPRRAVGDVLRGPERGEAVEDVVVRNIAARVPGRTERVSNRRARQRDVARKGRDSVSWRHSS